VWIIGTEALVNDLPVLAAGTHESCHAVTLPIQENARLGCKENFAE